MLHRNGESLKLATRIGFVVRVLMDVLLTNVNARNIQRNGFKRIMARKTQIIHRKAGSKIKNYFLKMMMPKTFSWKIQSIFGNAVLGVLVKRKHLDDYAEIQLWGTKFRTQCWWCQVEPIVVLGSWRHVFSLYSHSRKGHLLARFRSKLTAGQEGNVLVIFCKIITKNVTLMKIGNRQS